VYIFVYNKHLLINIYV